VEEIVGLAVGTLWDGRVRVWSGLRYNTKTSIAGGAPWTGWTDDASQPGDIVCAGQVAGANLMIFSNGTVGKPGPPGSLAQTEPAVMVQSVDSGGDTTSGWSAWPTTPAGYALASGGVLGGQLSMADPEFTLSDSTLWLWAWAPDGKLYISAMNGDGSLNWTPFPPGSASGGVVWNLYGPNNSSQGLAEGILWHAPAINTEPLSEQPFLTLAVSTYPSATAPSSLSSASNWTAWKSFVPQLGADTGGVASLAACFLPDGNIQVFASDTAGNLWTIWQQQPKVGDQADWIWPQSWEAFPLPGGHQMPILNSGNLDYVPASLERNALALAQLATGGLQLFALDNDSVVWTTYKTSDQSDAPWSDWGRL
jgi:hypothetical protein